MSKKNNFVVSIFALALVLFVSASVAFAQVRTEDLYRAEDDGSYDTMSWLLGTGDIPTIDPGLATDTTSNQVIQTIFMGLTTIDEETAEVQDGVAIELTKGDIAEDGSITYTYRIRTDIPWV